MGNEGNIALGNGLIDSLSRAECKLLSTLAEVCLWDKQLYP